MTRCNECNSVITKNDTECYICGVVVPGSQKGFWRRKKEPKPVAPVTPLSNLLFMASLVLTAVSFLSSQKMSVSFSVTLSGILLLARILTDRFAPKPDEQYMEESSRRLALRPVPAARLYH